MSNQDMKRVQTETKQKDQKEAKAQKEAKKQAQKEARSESALEKIQKGRFSTRLKELKSSVNKTAPDEMYLFFNLSEVTEAAEFHYARAARWLEIVRNTLVLIPLMVTWLSLGLAALAYSQSINKDQSLASEPFLQQWVDGFPKLNVIQLGTFKLSLVWFGGRFTFVGVALTDFIVLLVIALLSFLALLLDERAQKRATKISGWLSDKLYALALQSPIRYVGSSPGDKGPVLLGVLNRAIADFDEALSKVNKTLTNFTGVTNEQHETVQKFLDGSTRVKEAAGELKTSFERMENIYNRLDERLPDIKEQVENIAEHHNQAAERIKEATIQLNQLAYYIQGEPYTPSSPKQQPRQYSSPIQKFLRKVFPRRR